MKRRDFLQTASASTLAALSAGAPRVFAETPKSAPAKAQSMILLWMGGAVSQAESFDPKRYSPFEKGMETKSLLSTCPPIDTVCDHIKFCEGLEELAKLADRGAVIRSYIGREYGAQGEDLQHIPIQYRWHTGYTLPATVPAPFLGAWISRFLGPKNPDIPPYIEIGRSPKTANVFLALDAFRTAGFMGAEHGSLMIPEAADAGRVVRSRLQPDRFQDRYEFFKRIVAATPVGQEGSSHQRESMLTALDNAYRLMNSPAVKAFDLQTEKKEIFDAYNTGPFGRGCLLARRLVEHGARFVEVHVDFENAKGWDTHENGHVGQMAMRRIIDRPIATLIRELDQRGLLDSTLVVLGTEFGRSTAGRGSTKSATINDMKSYGLHGHYGGAGVCCLWGGGIKGGTVYGRTNDEYPCETVENPVHIHDLHATLYHQLGLSPKLNFEFERRPFYITKDGAGQPIEALCT